MVLQVEMYGCIDFDVLFLTSVLNFSKITLNIVLIFIILKSIKTGCVKMMLKSQSRHTEIR